MIGLHPTQSGVSDDRDDLNTVEQTYRDDAEHEEILRTFRTCADTDDDLHQRASCLARLYIDFIVQGAEKMDEQAPSLETCTD